MKHRIIILLLAVFIVSIYTCHAYAQSTVDSSIGDSNGFKYPLQTRSFYAQNLYWVFWIDNCNSLHYKTSFNHTVWGNETNLGYIAGCYRYFDITLENDYIHVATVYDDDDIYYRKGTLNTNSTITWWADWQLAAASVYDLGFPSIAIDSNGLPWIGFYKVGGTGMSGVTKSSSSNGTWQTAATYPHNISSANTHVGVRLMALENGRMFMVYDQGGSYLAGKEWDGSAWSVQRTANTVPASTYAKHVWADNDIVNVLMRENGTNYLIWEQYDATTNIWSIVDTVNINPMYFTTSVTDSNDIYVFWGNVTSDHLYYIKYNNSDDSWYGIYDWVDESVIDGLASGYTINSDDSSNQTRVGAYYVALPTKLKYKTVDEPMTVTTLSPADITSSSATLRGEIASLGTGVVITRGFQFNTAASASGATDYSDTDYSIGYGIGVFTYHVNGLVSDSLYYYRAYAINTYGNTSYGDWIGFITSQPSYYTWPDDDTVDILPPLPDDPTGWYKTNVTFSNLPGTSIFNDMFNTSGYPIAFFWYLSLAMFITFIAICAYFLSRGQTIVVFLVGSVALGFFCSVCWLDWWMMVPWLIVGITSLTMERQYAV